MIFMMKIPFDFTPAMNNELEWLYQVMVDG